jgi:hypothetical protein
MALTLRHRSTPVLAALVLGLAGCVTPQGTPVPECGPDVAPVLEGTPRAMTDRPESIPIDCYRVIGDARIEVAFLMPPGPQCYAVESVEVTESADAVSLELRVGGIIDRLGACPEEEILWSVLVVLNDAIGDREVLDAIGSAG